MAQRLEQTILRDQDLCRKIPVIGEAGKTALHDKASALVRGWSLQLRLKRLRLGLECFAYLCESRLLPKRKRQRPIELTEAQGVYAWVSPLEAL